MIRSKKDVKLVSNALSIYSSLGESVRSFKLCKRLRHRFSSPALLEQLVKKISSLHSFTWTTGEFPEEAILNILCAKYVVGPSYLSSVLSPLSSSACLRDLSIDLIVKNNDPRGLECGKQVLDTASPF